MIDALIVILVLIIVVPAVVYLIKQKKRGEKCIGCPMSGQCAQGCRDCKK